MSAEEGAAGRWAARGTPLLASPLEGERNEGGLRRLKKGHVFLRRSRGMAAASRPVRHADRPRKRENRTSRTVASAVRKGCGVEPSADQRAAGVGHELLQRGGVSATGRQQDQPLYAQRGVLIGQLGRNAAARRDAQLQLAQRGGTRMPIGCLAQSGDAALGRIDVEREAVPALGAL